MRWATETTESASLLFSFFCFPPSVFFNFSLPPLPTCNSPHSKAAESRIAITMQDINDINIGMRYSGRDRENKEGRRRKRKGGSGGRETTRLEEVFLFFFFSSSSKTDTGCSRCQTGSFPPGSSPGSSPRGCSCLILEGLGIGVESFGEKKPSVEKGKRKRKKKLKTLSRFSSSLSPSLSSLSLSFSPRLKLPVFLSPMLNEPRFPSPWLPLPVLPLLFCLFFFPSFFLFRQFGCLFRCREDRKRAGGRLSLPLSFSSSLSSSTNSSLPLPTHY